MKTKNIFVALFVSLMLVLFPSVAKADEGVAKIGETPYATLDEAVAAAADGDTIVLLDDATTDGLNLSKDLTIQSETKEEKYTITFTKNGIALWGKALTFKDVDVVMNGIGSTPYTAEWNWMTICASKNSSLSLINSNMTMDGTDAGNKHAIYFTGNDKLNLTNSKLVIKNYQQDALEWDGGDGGYNVNIVDSTFLSDHNRSGFTGTFIVTVDNSNVDVVNSTGNGSNGSHFKTINSKFNFSNNGSCGLSAGSVNSTNTNFTLKNNGMAGLVISSASVSSKFDKDSKVYIENNGANIYGAFTVAADVTFEAGSILKVSNNTTVGIRVLDGILSWTGSANGKGILTVEEGVSIEVTYNVNDKIIDNIDPKRLPTNYSGSTYGGGIWANGTVKLPSNAVIYNNHALSAGDDIYVENGGSITFGSVGENWHLDGQYDCSDLINGWYEDGAVTYETGDELYTRRWEAHGNTPEEDYYILVNSGTYTGPLALKAAHDKLGTVIVSYIVENGETLYKDADGKETITIIGSVDDEYTTEQKAFEGYTFVKVRDDNATGTIKDGTIEVVYMYAKNSKVVVSYVTDKGEMLHDDVTLDGYIGKEYTTEQKEFEGYALLEVIGDKTGTFTEDTIHVTYIYQYVLGQGGEDLEPTTPVIKTGIEENNNSEVLFLTSSALLGVLLVLKKKFI